MAEPLTIAAAAPLVRTGELTPSELLEQCLRRIDVYEPAVKAWAYLDRERARRDAAIMTEQAKAGRYRGPLHGIPVGVKDIIDVFDMPTGCGSKLWANSYARRDATVVEWLRAAGAVILGKTVTTPYAYLDPPPTRNPWDLTRTPGGSSSGSAAAVACGMCLAAVGTQTGGSITRPASYCGVAGMKASYFRVSRSGVLPLAPTLDHVGFLARTAGDLAVLLEATAGSRYRNPYEWDEPLADLSGAAGRALAGHADDTRLLRLGGAFRDAAHPAVEQAMSAVATSLADSPGVAVTDVRAPAWMAPLAGHNRAIYATEAYRTHGDRQPYRPDEYPPQITELVRDGRTVDGKTYADALRFRRAVVQFDATDISAGTYLTPAAPDFPPDPRTTGSPLFNSPWSFVGYPTVSLPAGWSVDGLPWAVQLVSGLGAEARLFADAVRVERVLDFAHRLPPVPA